MRKLIIAVAAAALTAISLGSCGNGQSNSDRSDSLLVDAARFDTVVDGKQVKLYTLGSDTGMQVQVTNYGLRVVSIIVPDRDGRRGDVAIGYGSISEYLDNPGERFLGCIVGRYANRIAGGRFSIDGADYQLPLNDNGQTLHGGLKGLDCHVWTVDSVSPTMARFSYTSPDGDEGFPGEMRLTVTYSVLPGNEFEIQYAATTDKPTHINLSNHTFFNLAGEGNPVAGHEVTIVASHYTPVDSVLIPTGEIASVEGTPLDFRSAHAIGERVESEFSQITLGHGYDHNWVLDSVGVRQPSAIVYEPVSGRQMEVITDQPGLQFYGGNFFNGAAAGKHGHPIAWREAFAMEAQHFPDSPNHPQFPSTLLMPGETYTQTTIYRFSVR